MTRVCGAKRLGLKIEAKRPGGKRLGGETSCYQVCLYHNDPKFSERLVSHCGHSTPVICLSSLPPVL